MNVAPESSASFLKMGNHNDKLAYAITFLFQIWKESLWDSVIFVKTLL